MDTKLTLKLDAHIIESAKSYASKKNVSVSKLVENYLAYVTNEQKDEFKISPFVKSIATGKNIPDDYDYKQDYTDYLQDKYK